jgi:hypothetical protein
MSANESGPLKQQLHLLSEGPILLVDQGLILEGTTFAVADKVKAVSGGRIADADSILEALLEEGHLLLEAVGIKDELQLKRFESVGLTLLYMIQHIR